MDITKLMPIFNFSLLLVFLVFYERHKNNERLKNPFYKTIERILSKYFDKEFTDVVAIHCSLPVEKVESFQESVIELLQNKVQFEELGRQYIERLISSDES